MIMKNTWIKFGGAAVAVALLVTAGVAVAHGMRGGGAAFAYEGDPASGSVTNVTYNGTTLLESVSSAPADASVHARGPAVGVRALNATTVTLVLPADATVVVHDAVESWSPAGATITYASGLKANLALKNGTLSQDGQTLTLALDDEGGASFGLVRGDGFGPGKGFGPMHAFGGARGGHGGPGGVRGPGGHR